MNYFLTKFSHFFYCPQIKFLLLWQTVDCLPNCYSYFSFLPIEPHFGSNVGQHLPRKQPHHQGRSVVSLSQLRPHLSLLPGLVMMTTLKEPTLSPEIKRFPKQDAWSERWVFDNFIKPLNQSWTSWHVREYTTIFLKRLPVGNSVTSLTTFPIQPQSLFFCFFCWSAPTLYTFFESGLLPEPFETHLLNDLSFSRCVMKSNST